MVFQVEVTIIIPSSRDSSKLKIGFKSRYNTRCFLVKHLTNDNNHKWFINYCSAWTKTKYRANWCVQFSTLPRVSFCQLQVSWHVLRAHRLRAAIHRFQLLFLNKNITVSIAHLKFTNSGKKKTIGSANRKHLINDNSQYYYLILL